MPDMPELLFEAVKKIAEGESHQQQKDDFDKLNKRIERNHKKLSFILLGVAAFIIATIILSLPPENHQKMFNAPILSWLSASVGSVFVWLGLKK